MAPPAAGETTGAANAKAGDAAVTGWLMLVLDAILASMKDDGLQVETPGETVQDLARQNHKSPEEVLQYFVR